MPDGADTVIPVEDTDEYWRDRSRPLPDSVQIYRAVSPGAYVRLPGEDIQAGSQVLSPGSVLRPQELGLIASLGYQTVSVISRPKIGILATGNELVDIAQPLGPGQIRNSNSYTQAAQVLACNAEPVILGVANDSEESVRERLQLGIDEGVDLIISSAGVSVGAYDVVKSVLETDGSVLFWRVRMRPGKPLTFGFYQGVPYLGLPGNPVSAMVSFDRFARPAILKMSGYKQIERRGVSVVIEDEIHSDGRESYLRAVVKREGGEYRASIFGGQGSHMLSSLVGANALVKVPENVEYVGVGSMLEAIMIDWPETVF
jgi:molybdopterin molybdotransferase